MLSKCRTLITKDGKVAMRAQVREPQERERDVRKPNQTGNKRRGGDHLTSGPQSRHARASERQQSTFSPSNTHDSRTGFFLGAATRRQSMFISGAYHYIRYVSKPFGRAAPMEGRDVPHDA